MNEAIGKIRAALKGHDLLGAEAIDLKPGAVVLVVLRPPATASPSDIEAVGRTWGAMAEMLQAEGVRAVACCVPHGFALDVIEVAGEAPPDDRSVVGADGREIARLRPLPTAPAVTSTIEAEAERWRKAGIAAHAAGDLGAQAIAMARCDSLTGAVRAVRGQACFGVVPVLSSPPPSPSEVEAVTRRADAAAQAFVAYAIAPPPPLSAADLLIGVYPNGPGAEVRTFTTAEEVRAAYGPEVRGPGGEPWNATAAAVDAMAAAPLPPDEPFPWDAPAEGFGVATEPTPPGYYHNHLEPCGVEGCHGWPGQLRQDAAGVAALAAAAARAVKP